MKQSESRISLQTVLRFAGTFAAILLLILWFRQLGWREVLAAIRGIPAISILLAIMLMLISRLAVAARWHTLLRSAGGRVSYGQALRITLAGLFASNFLPTTIGGDVVRLLGGIQLHLEPALCAASLIVDRLTGVLGMTVVLPFGLAQMWKGWQPFTATLSDPWVTSTVFFPARMRSWFKKWFSEAHRFVQRVINSLSFWLKTPHFLGLGLIFTWLHMLCLFTAIWFFITGLNEDLSHIQIGGLWSLVYFVTLLPLSINGLGIQEVAITFFFSTVGGIRLEAALSLAILIRALGMVASLPGVAFIPLILSFDRKQPASIQPIDDPTYNPAPGSDR